MRRAKNFTQVELANASGLSVGFVRAIEQGSYAPSFETLEALAKALDVEVMQLFNFADETGKT